MKKLILLFSLITCNLLSQVSISNLIANYPFNGNANDNSGNNLNGIINGATLTTDRFGNNNSAYYFNGKSKITIPYNSLLDFDTIKSVTVSTWIQINNNFNKFKFFISYGCGDTIGNGGFQLGIDVPPMNLYYEFGSVYYGTTNMYDSTWHCIAIVFNRTIDSAVMYMDGSLLKKVYIPDSISYTPSCKNDFFIGGERNNDTCHYFIGKIDDVKIFNRALNKNEVALLCGSELNATNIDDYNIYPNPSNDHFKLDINCDYKIIVKNMMGQIVLNEYMTKENNTVKLQESGIYIIERYDLNNKLLNIKRIVLL